MEFSVKELDIIVDTLRGSGPAGGVYGAGPWARCYSYGTGESREALAKEIASTRENIEQTHLAFALGSIMMIIDTLSASTSVANRGQWHYSEQERRILADKILNSDTKILVTVIQ